MAVRKRRRAAEPKQAMVETVKVYRAATLEINDAAYGPEKEREEAEAFYNSDGRIRRLEIKQGYLIGFANCGQDAVVCHEQHIPELIAFLQKATAEVDK